MKKDAKTTIVCGQTGSGKTMYIKKSLLPRLAKLDLYIYDVNQEYLSFPNKQAEYIDMKSFVDMAFTKTNSTFLFEEATAFFSQKFISQRMLELLVRKRHMNNYFIFVFHSLRTIPVHILEFTNYLVLFKTNDRNDILRSKYKFNPEIFESFEMVNDLPPYFPVVKELY